MLIDPDTIVTKFTDYAIRTPEFFIDFITSEITKRDVRGLTNDRVQEVNISGEHPLVRMTASALVDGKVNTKNFLPAISVIEDDENEEYTTIGDGTRPPIIVDQEFVDQCKAIPIKDRIADGLITDKQLALIEQAILNNKDRSTTGEGKLLAHVEGFFMKEVAFVSVWGSTLNERNIIGDVVRSVIFDMKKAMREAKIKDTHIRTSKGLVNSNFGRIIYGQESMLEFTNFFHNITVTTEYPRSLLLQECPTISVFDAIKQSTEEICTNIKVNPRFTPAGYPEQGKANIFTGEAEE